MEVLTAFLLVLSFMLPCHGWECTEGPQHPDAAQIDAGQGQVVMRDRNSQVFLLSGSTWTKLGTVPLQHVSVGSAGIWGTDSTDKVYKYVAGDFLSTSGQTLRQVDAGGRVQVAGVTRASTIHCLITASSLKEVTPLSWNVFHGLLMYISCGLYGCWGVNTGHNIFFTAPQNCVIGQWTRVEGAAVMVEVGTDGNVFVVNAGGQLYQRTGISAEVPHGTGWVQLPMSETIKHASYDLERLWLVSSSGVIKKCIRRGWECTKGPQHPDAAQIDAGQGQVVMRDRNSQVFYLSGSNWTKLGSVALQHVSVGPAGIWGTDASNNVFKYVAGDFILACGQTLEQVDAGGDGHVFGLSKYKYHCLKSSIATAFNQVGAPSWDSSYAELKYLSCSPDGCWGVTSDHSLLHRTVRPDTCKVEFESEIAGSAFMVEAGTDGTVVIVNPSGEVFERTGVSKAFPLGTGWTLIPLSETIRHASYDQSALWAVSDGGAILRCTK